MATGTAAPAITGHEAAQINRANATNATPVVFVHGLWLLPSSWDRWVALFEAAGYVALTPGWPPVTTLTSYGPATSILLKFATW